MQKERNLRVLPKTEVDNDAAFFAASCLLLVRWLNVVEARKRVSNDVERAAVERVEVSVASDTGKFLKL